MLIQDIERVVKMMYEFKINDNSRHVWGMRVIISNNTDHSVVITSPNCVDYRFFWCNGDLAKVSVCGSSYLAYGKFAANPDSFRKVFSRIPMWILKKIDFYYNVFIAE